jgi:hypothetical protein
MLVNKIFLLPIILLIGCATQEPVIKIVTQKVEVPVAVPCKEEAPPPPDFCFVKIQDGTDIYVQVRCLLSDRKLGQGYQTELLAKLNACK